MFVTSGELYRGQMATLERLSAFVGQPLSFRSQEARTDVENGIFRNSKSKGTINLSTQHLLWVLL